MGYDYRTQREKLFTDEGQRLFLAWRDHAERLLDEAGAFMFFGDPPGFSCVDRWDALACADRMVELGELRELTGPNVFAQHRVFVRGRS